jgi:hypothetical protein
MYQDYVTTKEEAICHLFFHCCFKDGNFSPDEIDTVSSKFVELQMQRDLNIKEELSHYRSYRTEIGDETEYLRYLLKLINPVQNFALYSYCCELCLSDKLLTTDEEALLNKIAALTDIDTEQSDTISELITQRKAVELEKIF